MKYSLRSLVLLIGIACVVFTTGTMAYQRGFQDGQDDALQVITLSGGAIRTDKTTDELLDELLAGLDVAN